MLGAWRATDSSSVSWRTEGWMYDESLRKEELQDAIPILSFAEESDSR